VFDRAAHGVAGSFGHAELVLHKTRGDRKDGSKFRMPSSGWKNDEIDSGLANWRRGDDRNQASLKACTVNRLSRPLGASKGTVSLAGFGARNEAGLTSLARRGHLE